MGVRNEKKKRHVASWQRCLPAHHVFHIIGPLLGIPYARQYSIPFGFYGTFPWHMIQYQYGTMTNISQNQSKSLIESLNWHSQSASSLSTCLFQQKTLECIYSYLLFVIYPCNACNQPLYNSSTLSSIKMRSSSAKVGALIHIKPSVCA